MEDFQNLKSKERHLEDRDQEIADKLSYLGIEFDYTIEDDGRLIYNFYNVKQLGHSAFLLNSNEKKIVYQSLHFGGDKFEEPESEKEVTPDELTQYLSEKFPDVDNIIFSCCNPDRARILFGAMDGKIIFIGTGPNNFSTFYYDKERRLSSVRNVKRE